MADSKSDSLPSQSDRQKSVLEREYLKIVLVDLKPYKRWNSADTKSPVDKLGVT